MKYQAMNERQILLVQHTFERASRFGAHFSATFYGELFAIDPSLKQMFSGDMIAQGQKLMGMLAYVVSGLRDRDALLPELRALAARHVAYGVEAAHYAAVGTALLRTLRHELGPDLTLEAREAWTTAYQWLSGVMRETAYGPAPTR